MLQSPFDIRLRSYLWFKVCTNCCTEMTKLSLCYFSRRIYKVSFCLNSFLMWCMSLLAVAASPVYVSRKCSNMIQKINIVDMHILSTLLLLHCNTWGSQVKYLTLDSNICFAYLSQGKQNKQKLDQVMTTFPLLTFKA